MNLLSTSCTHPLYYFPPDCEYLEELPEDPYVAGEYFYQEPDLSGGVEGVDYIIAYGADNEGEGSEQQQQQE